MGGAVKCQLCAAEQVELVEVAADVFVCDECSKDIQSMSDAGVIDLPNRE